MKYVWIGTLALAGILQGSTALAQQPDKRQETRKEEKIVLKKEGKDKTVIEIRDGEVWVNGEKVASKDDRRSTYRKIIIDGRETDPDKMPELGEFFGRGGGDMPAPPRKAMLGVLTDPQQSKNGAFVQEVTPNSPAEELGLKEGDLITGIDGKEIASSRELIEAIGSHEPGEKVKITYRRDGKTMTGEAELEKAARQEPMARMFRFGPEMGGGELPDMLRNFPFNAGDNPFDPAPKLGISAEDRADGNGVTVLEVKPGSPADKAGLKENDVVTKLNDEKTGSVEELQATLRELKPNEKTKLEYERSGRKMSTEVVLPKPLRKKDL